RRRAPRRWRRRGEDGPALRVKAMTEREWLAGTDSRAMLSMLARPRGRKLLLFCCACCRRAWPEMASNHSRRAVESSERSADGPWGNLVRDVIATFPATFTVDLSPADAAASWTA